MSHREQRTEQRTEGRRPWMKQGGAMLWFPLLLCYCELLLHGVMGMDWKYAPIYLSFSASLGLWMALAVGWLPGVLHQGLTLLLTLGVGVLYGVQLLCKQILQSYYPFSTLHTALDNRLLDYGSVIWDGVQSHWMILSLLLLPTLILLLLGRWLVSFRPYGLGQMLILLVGGIGLHLLALGLLTQPWTGDMQPKELYEMDSYLEDQVEQFGLATMLRLDGKHKLFPKEGVRELEAQGVGETEVPEDTEGTPPSEAEEAYHQLPVDLEKLRRETELEDVVWLADYVGNRPPTAHNPYTGMFQGYHVIMFSLEGFSAYAIDPELTPTLYRLTQEGFVFRNFYTPLHYTSTSGGECQNLLGLYPKAGNPITMKETGVRQTDCAFSLAQQLKKEGYRLFGYHGNQDMYGRYASHTNLGYQWKQYQTGLNLEMKVDGSTYAWPQSDLYVLNTSLKDYLFSSDPFHVYYMTISGHMPYNFNRVAKKYRDLVEPLPYSQETKAYLATVIEVDRMFQALLEALEEAGQLDRTLIVASADHIPYFNVNILEELSGKKFGKSEEVGALNEKNLNFDVYRNGLILWSSTMSEPVVVDKPCGQVDILPTVSNLLGLEYDSRMLAGTDSLSDSPPLVIFSSQSWLTDRGFYNRYTQEFTPAPGVEMTQEEEEIYVSQQKKEVRARLAMTEKIIQTDFYRLIEGVKIPEKAS